MTKFTIDIYSDTLCPFCYIGKKSLDRAIGAYRAAHPDADFDLVWRPWLLHPRVRPPTAVDRRAYFRAKYGGGARADAFFAGVEARAAPLGLRIVWDGTSGSSWDSHKLVLRAMDLDRADGAGEEGGGEGEGEGQGEKGGGRQQAMLDGIFRGVFEEGHDVSDRAFLARCAVEAGVAASEEEAREWMDSKELESRVAGENAKGRERGFEAVPSYLVQGRYLVGGMQEPEVFAAVFDRVGQKESVRARTVGESC